MNRQNALKSILWLLVGVWITVSIARFLRGLGATTGLSDAAPWGLWIAFDVMTGVALAAGGFVIAATVYIFGAEKFRVFARPAILTAFLGYGAVAVGLLYDIGVPLHIWHPMVYHQTHSVLFEVAMCVMLYLTVLFLEFCPVILEHPLFNRPLFKRVHGFLKRITIPLVIAGIVLSTLHQSSLGSLFLIAPYRVHPLWYSPIIWVLFFVSAIGLGLMVVAAESMFSSWYFGHKLRVDLLSTLGKAASVVLFLYLGLRLGDLAVRGTLGAAFDGSWQSLVFLFEIGLSVLIPAVLLAIPAVRQSVVGMGVCSAMTILGVMGYRFNLSIVAFARPEGISYFPSWMEVSVTLGIVSAAILVFIFFVENLNVCAVEHEEEPSHKAPMESAFHPLSLRWFMPESLAGPRRYSLAALMGAALALALLPKDVWLGPQPLTTPVFAPRVVDGLVERAPRGIHGPIANLAVRAIENPVSPNAEPLQLFLIDGNRDGRLVPFYHDFLRDELGGDDSCRLCHHQVKPFDQNTACHECHRDMYVETDIFNHHEHIRKLGDNRSCAECHLEGSSAVKSRNTAKACSECHTDMLIEGSTVPPPEEGMKGYAVGYMDAMHSLCVTCHQQKVVEEPFKFPSNFADCATCHLDIDGSDLLRMRPYITDELTPVTFSTDADGATKKDEAGQSSPSGSEL